MKKSQNIEFCVRESCFNSNLPKAFSKRASYYSARGISYDCTLKQCCHYGKDSLKMHDSRKTRGVAQPDGADDDAAAGAADVPAGAALASAVAAAVAVAGAAAAPAVAAPAVASAVAATVAAVVVEAARVAASASSSKLNSENEAAS